MSDNSLNTKKAASLFQAAAIFILTAIAAPAFPGGDGSVPSFFFLAAGGGGAAWLCFRCGYIYGILSAVAGFFLNWYVQSSPLAALAAFSLVPVGITYALVSKRRLSRSQALGISAASVSALCLAAVIIPVWQKTGSFGLQQIKSTFPEFFEKLAEALSKSFTITVAGQKVPFITAESADAYVNLIIAVSPGFAVAAIISLCFAAGWVYRLLLRLSGCEPPEPSDWKLLPVPITAAFYCISVLAAAVSGSDNIIWLAAFNIAAILTPWFFFAGAASVGEMRMVDGFRRPRILRSALLFFSVFLGLPAAIGLCCIFGVYDSIRTLFPKKKTEE